MARVSSPAQSRYLPDQVTRPSPSVGTLGIEPKSRRNRPRSDNQPTLPGERRLGDPSESQTRLRRFAAVVVLGTSGQVVHADGLEPSTHGLEGRRRSHWTTRACPRERDESNAGLRSWKPLGHHDLAPFGAVEGNRTLFDPDRQSGARPTRSDGMGCSEESNPTARVTAAHVATTTAPEWSETWESNPAMSWHRTRRARQSCCGGWIRTNGGDFSQRLNKPLSATTRVHHNRCRRVSCAPAFHVLRFSKIKPWVRVTARVRSPACCR